jgi:hypothetical protein
MTILLKKINKTAYCLIATNSTIDFGFKVFYSDVFKFCIWIGLHWETEAT